MVMSSVHVQTNRLDRRGGSRLNQNACFDGLELDGLGTRGREEEIEALDGFSAALAQLIPFEVVAAFRMVFVPACDADVVADDAAGFSFVGKNGIDDTVLD